jgi:aldehyde:ferredoxin oxidoreductase
MFGYHGNYRRINASTGTDQRMPICESVFRRVLGGVGLGTWLLLENSPPRFDPLSPESPLIFAFSPLVGTPLTTSAKFAIVCKSPLTQRLNDALSSSHFALNGKRTGSDAIVIRGACEQPSILLIDENGSQLLPADSLWGQSAPDATRQLNQRFGSEYQFAVIGPAGENLVRFSTISHQHRHAGRGGLGAVMGSKRIKAIGVRGSQRTELFDAPAVVKLAKELSRKSFGPATEKYRELGTVANLLTFNRLNVLPTRNYQQGSFEEAPALSGEALNELHRVARNSCAACTIGCEHLYATKEGKSVRLEYESLFALGPLCGIGDREIVLQAARLCDDLGLDTISTGGTIAFAMECVERELLPESDLRFGNDTAFLRTIQQIARREGIGNLLAEGSRLAAEQIGGEAIDFAPQVKGLEMPGYEPRTLQTMALGLAVNSRGADHNRSGAYEADFAPGGQRLHGSEASARAVIDSEDRAALIDSLILCKFLRGVFTDLYTETAELLHTVTGWNLSAAEMRTFSRIIIEMKHEFNQREGWTPAEDTLPRRFLSTALPAAESPGGSLSEEQLQRMVQAYHRERGW